MLESVQYRLKPSITTKQDNKYHFFERYTHREPDKPGQELAPLDIVQYTGSNSRQHLEGSTGLISGKLQGNKQEIRHITPNVISS